ncbi:MAG: murein biosynthesis integral membrane protein MurJ [Gemmatimonadota bacterium]
MSMPVPGAGRSRAEGGLTGYPAGHAGEGAWAAPPAAADPVAAGPDPAGPGVPQAGPETASVARSSGVMALGTLASRGTGFLRTLVLVYALGVTFVSSAYNNANTIPNAVYDLMMGGVLTSGVVPLLVNAAKRDSDRGQAYEQRTFTLAVVSLAGLTVVATAAASLIVALYASALPPATLHLTVIFAYFFIPQVFFYGVCSLAGGVLNARGRFAAPMWTPVINNIVVIAVLLLFIATGGLSAAGRIGGGQVLLLGVGTTLGIVAQTAALVPALRVAGFRWHPRFDFRREEVREVLRMAGPLFGYTLTTFISFLVVQNVANKASVHAPQDGFPTYTYAFQLFQMPYAIIGISVITALLPRMSAHAAERKYALVRDDFSGGVRLSSVVVVPAALLLAVLGAPLAEGLLGYGHTSSADAGYIGLVFGIFSLGLVPYMLFQLLLRVFYALHDSRTPMFIGVAVMAANIVISLLALFLLPSGHVVEGLAAAFGLANAAGTVVSWRILSRRLDGLDGHIITRSMVRMHLATVPGMLFAIAATFMFGVLLAPGPVFGIVTVIFGGSGALLLYVLFSRAFGVGEFSELTSGLIARFRR